MMTMTKKIGLTLIGLLAIFCVSAQETKKFSPEKFQADLEDFIAKEACLSPQQASAFFPIYREMQKKQRVIYEKMRRLWKIKPADEAGCRKAISERDAMDLELKQMQQIYHERFFMALPASKVYDVIKAEERFHRRMMKGWAKERRNNN